MKITYTFKKPTDLVLTDVRNRVDIANLGQSHRLFEGDAEILVGVDGPLSVEAAERLRDAVEGYVFTPRAFVFPAPDRYRIEDLSLAFSAAGVVGFSGLSSDGSGNLRAEFPDRIEPFSDAENVALGAVVSGYVFVPTWDAVRAERAPLLDAADKRINTREDNGEDAITERRYRQALRDVTKQSDPENPVWPTRPW